MTNSVFHDDPLSRERGVVDLVLQRTGFAPTDDPTDTQPIRIPPETLAELEAAQEAALDDKATQKIRVPRDVQQHSRSPRRDPPGTSQETSA